MLSNTAQQEYSEFRHPNLEVLYTEDQIRERIQELGEQITREYAGRELVLVSVLKGSCVFLADLMRVINLPLTIDFMSVSSYKDGKKSTGDVEILKDLSNPIRGKDVVVVEDIVDTGLTLSRLLEILGSRGAASIKLATFLDKPGPRIKKELKIDFTGFTVPDQFVVGYGLDAAGRYRNLPFIAVVKDPSEA
ncbi:MAG: hypoxanthine phosphoribosyltransferase [Acidobacteria bacterium]|nr:hypoxanthine phosphoribosyltransferase [Acidobacteriota bacterium]MCA1607842.1 hypoxanthine phosphoribosyltransferase [Acidobacteriota bacterium]